MFISIDSQTILDALNIVSRAIPSKSVKPILEGICVRATETDLTLTASDGQLSIQYTHPIIAAQPGTAIFPGRLFSDLIRKAPNTTISITADDTSAKIQYGKSKSRLACLAGPYPDTPDFTPTQSISIPAVDFKNMASRVMFAIATDDTRPILTGALLETTPAGICMTAIDGFRLAQQTTPLHTTPFNVVIPRKVIDELSRILPATSDPLTIDIHDGRARFTFGNVCITSTLLAGTFVDYSRIIPDSFTTSLQVDRSALLAAVDRASLLARDGKNDLVKLSIANNTITVSSQSQTGDTAEEIDVAQNGNDLAISFNSRYISEALKNAQSDTLILNFNTPNSPCVISPASNDYLYLILPVRTM